MKTLIINNQPVNMQVMMEDVITSVQQGFTGYGKFTAEAVVEMLRLLNNSSMEINKDVPSDYEHPSWNAKNRVYEWKNYVAKEFQEIWENLPHSQKVIISTQAQKKAMNESWE